MGKEDNYLSPEEIAEEKGFNDINEFLEDLYLDSIVPACCKKGCEIEIDGVCPHGFKSVVAEVLGI